MNDKPRGEVKLDPKPDLTILPTRESKKIKVNIFDKFWVWLNGRKTKIGLYAGGIGALTYGIGSIVYPPLAAMGQGITYIGTATFGGGLIHKFIKGKVKYGNGEVKKLSQLITETITVFYGWIQYISHLKKKGGD